MKHDARGRPRIWSDEWALALLVRAARRLGRTPYVNELKAMHCPTVGFYKRRFGSFRKAVELAGLTPNPEGGRLSVWIDPEKAARLTEEKRRYWGSVERSETAKDLPRHGLATWTHPYAKQQRSA